MLYAWIMKLSYSNYVSRAVPDQHNQEIYDKTRNSTEATAASVYALPGFSSVSMCQTT